MNLGSEAGRGEGVFILLRYSLGVSFLVGSERNAVGFGEDDDCDLVTRLSGLFAVVAAADAAVEAEAEVASAAAASSAVSSSPQGHMEREKGLSRVPACFMRSPNGCT